MKNSISIAEYKKQLAPKKHYAQHEKKLQMDFGKILAGFEQFKKFSPDLIKFSYIANGELRPAEIINGKRKSRVGTELKIKGVRPGIFDYFFNVKRELNGVKIGYDIWLEAKSMTGQMTKEQREFKKNCEGVENIKIYEFRSVHEGVNILEKEGVVKL